MPALTDFPDRLSPMLVKELRQGLRTRTFVALFLALQALLAVILLAAAGARTYDDAGPTLSRVIFLLFALAVLVIQPLRGMTAVSSEIRGHTLDLLVLTRLSAWRIVLGKWVALVGQSALLLAAIAPYLILRYFFGRMDLFAELLLLGGIFLASMFLTAVTVGLSGSPSLVVRGLLPVLGAPLLVVAILVVCLSPGLDEFIGFFSLGDSESRVVFAIGVGLACHVAWSALDFAAAAIAPLAENHATPRRLAALALALAGTAFALAAPAGWAAWTLLPLAICLTPAIAISLTEPRALLPVACTPFVRRGAAGRALGRLLYPGWPTAVPFVVPLAALLAVCAWRADVGGEAVFLLCCWFGTLLFPAACVLPFERATRHLFGLYATVLAAGTVFALVLAMLAEAMHDEHFLWLFAWLPQAQFVISTQNLASDETLVAVATACDLILLAVLGILATCRQDYIAHAEQAARAAARHPATPPP